jgi:thioredoxin reductase (NADPH)
MVTADEIRSVKLFEDLSDEECERLSRAAADITLAPREYAAHSGSERALFAVLEGVIEAIQVVDGIERTVGSRKPGDVFGEVPIALGTLFPVGFRAAGPSRVLRLEPHDYHAIAAAQPEVAKELGRLARNRMGGAHGLAALAADAPPPRALVAGHRLDRDCSELRRFLDRNTIHAEWVDAGSADAAEQWDGPLPDELPALRVVADGTTVVRPSLRQAAELLGLETEPEHEAYDVVVVGGGPAGLAAAVYGASEGLRTIVVERETPGGQAGTSSKIENYLGFPQGLSGAELATRALDQAKRLGAEILVTRNIEHLDAAAREVHLDEGDVLRARTIILATGVSWRQLGVEGCEDLTGKGVAYGAARSDARNTHGLDVHLVGAGNSAGQAALSFATHAKSVTIICRSDSLGKSMSHYLVDQIGDKRNIDVRLESEVVRAHGVDALEAIEVRDGAGRVERLECGGLYIFIGADAETTWLPPEIALDSKGFVLTGADVRDAGRWELERDPYLLETSVPGVFACGDVRSGPVKRVAAAVGEGSMAIAFVHQYLGGSGLPRSAETRKT